jgi:hypothetical protein
MAEWLLTIGDEDIIFEPGITVNQQNGELYTLIYTYIYLYIRIYIYIILHILIYSYILIYISICRLIFMSHLFVYLSHIKV